MTYYAHGKEVLRHKLHYADAVTAEAAETIAAALNRFRGAVEVPCDICKLVGMHVPSCENGRGAGQCSISDASAKPVI